MSKLNMTNLKKVLRYLKKNGVSKTYYSVKERLCDAPFANYTYEEISEEEERRQRELSQSFSHGIKFSIAVPCYETNEAYLCELMDSVLAQTYENWELILADASTSDKVKDTVSEYVASHSEENNRIVYVRLTENKGIAENTNEATLHATGEYTALLDHDDLLTKDALFCMAKAIEESKEQPLFLYSDEDKLDENGKYFEPNFKLDFNLEYLLSNNYICHLLVAKTEALKNLNYRGEFDGAQDYDVILRLVQKSYKEKTPICHISKVLYHWRCHIGSTAANPESKLYAYEAGKRAVESFVKDMGWSGTVDHAEHLGYYRVNYDMDKIWEERPSLGAVGGPVYKRSKICGGAMDKDGKVLYAGENRHAFGYMNRLRMKQNVQALDMRNIMVRPEVLENYQKTVNAQNADKLTEIEKSLAISAYLRDNGYELIYDPEWKE